MTSSANSSMLRRALSIGMLPYLNTNMISFVPNASASSVARAIVCSGVPHGCESKKPRRNTSLLSRRMSDIAP